MNDQQPFILFGGTFDPLHLGHIRMARTLQKELRITNIQWLPCHIPPHKGVPSASPSQRVAMLQAFCQKHPEFHCNDIELQKSSPSYSVETLQAIRSQIGQTQPLWFCMGADSYLSLHKWYQWQALPTLCHIIVFPRHESSHQPTSVLQDRVTSNPEILFQQPNGAIFHLSAANQAISSTELKQRLCAGDDVSEWLDPTINDYIFANGLYGTGTLQAR